MTDQPPPKTETINPLSDAQKALKELVGKLPKEQRKPYLDGLLAWRKERAKLTDAEKVVFDRFAKYVGLPPLSEPDRAWLVSEAKRIALLSEADSEAFWAYDDWLEKGLEKAVPVAVDMIREAFTNPNNFRSVPLTEEHKTHWRKEFETIKAATGEDTLQVCIQLIEGMLEGLMREIEPLKSYAKIDGYLRILLGDSYLSPLPLTLQGHLKARGIDKDVSILSFDELMEYLYLPEKEPWIDTVLPTLDMLFARLYQWPEGTAKTKTISDLCLALEHAIEHNDPSRPSVWEIT